MRVNSSNDDEIIEIIEGADGYWDVVGSTEIDKIERLVDLDLEDDDYTTIAGFLMSEAGQVMAEGEIVPFNGHIFKIEKVEKHRILEVRMEKRADSPSDDEDSDNDQ